MSAQREDGVHALVSTASSTSPSSSWPSSPRASIRRRTLRQWEGPPDHKLKLKAVARRARPPGRCGAPSTFAPSYQAPSPLALSRFRMRGLLSSLSVDPEHESSLISCLITTEHSA